MAKTAELPETAGGVRKPPSLPFLLALGALALLFWWMMGLVSEHDQTVRLAYFALLYVPVLVGMLLVQGALLLACRRLTRPPDLRVLLVLLPLGALVLLKTPLGHAVRWMGTRLQAVCESVPREPAPILQGMTQQVPPGWQVGENGLNLYATRPELATDLRRILANTRARAQTLTGRETPPLAGEPAWIRIYYAGTVEEYASLYERVTGREPASLGGMAEFAPRPPCVFGCAEIGGGSMGHELTHVLIMRDWPTIPGWFNEALAQALGAPNQSQRASRIARVALAAGTWIHLEGVIRLQHPDYNRLTTGGRVVSHGGLEGTMTRLITGHAFVWWVHETGRLATFYQTFRDTRDVAAACRQLGFPSIQATEQAWLAWLKAQDPSPAAR